MFLIFMMGRQPDSTLGKCKILIGMLTAGMVNKQISRHIQAFERTIFSLRTNICQMGSVKTGHHAVRPRNTTRREGNDNVTSFEVKSVS